MKKSEIIERGLITTYRKRLWSRFIKAIKEYELVNEGDRICVCISGGKDSMLMAKLFQELKKHSPVKFEVEYLVMDPGYNPKNIKMIKTNLDILGIPATIKQTDIFSVANNMDKNPCYICARMRRGALYQLAKDMGCNKIALGHHFDDVIETILMNMLNTGSFQTMLPKLHSDNFEGMELIRPLYFIRLRDIITWKDSNDLKFIECACRFTERNNMAKNGNSNSQRIETRKLIEKLLSYNENVEWNIFKSSENINMDKILGYKKGGQKHSYLEDYNKDKK